MNKSCVLSMSLLLVVGILSTNCVYGVENMEEPLLDTHITKIKEENNVNYGFSELKELEDEMNKEGTNINEQLDKFIEEDLKYFSPEEAEQVREMIDSNRPYYLLDNSVSKRKKSFDA